jgi:CRP-like cAMP-binding protein
MVNQAIYKPRIEQLRSINLFRAFTEAELQELMTSGTVKSFEPHSNVIIEGELSWGLFLILEGIVGVFKTNSVTSDIHDVGQLRSGQQFGEMSLIDDSPRSATVRTLVESHLFVISRESVHQIIDRSPDVKMRFYENCIHDLVSRLREINESYVTSQFQLWKTMLNSKEAA